MVDDSQKLEDYRYGGFMRRGERVREDPRKGDGTMLRKGHEILVTSVAIDPALHFLNPSLIWI